MSCERHSWGGQVVFHGIQSSPVFTTQAWNELNNLEGQICFLSKQVVMILNSFSII